MTCIVGIEHAEGVTLGADSTGSNGWTKLAYRTPKLVRLELTDTGREMEPIVLGYTSSYRMGDILRYLDDVPHRKAQPAEKWLIRDFIPRIRKEFRDSGFIKKTNEEETGGNFLIGVAGELYEVQPDFSVLRSACGFASVGSGQDVALASLYTTAKAGLRKLTTEERLGIALQAAADLTTFVGPPFHFMSVEGSA